MSYPDKVGDESPVVGHYAKKPDASVSLMLELSLVYIIFVKKQQHPQLQRKNLP